MVTRVERGQSSQTATVNDVLTGICMYSVPPALLPRYLLQRNHRHTLCYRCTRHNRSSLSFYFFIHLLNVGTWLCVRSPISYLRPAAMRLNQRVVESEGKVEDAVAQAREAKDLIAGFIKTTEDKNAGAVSSFKTELEKSEGKVMCDIAAFNSKLHTLESFVRESTARLDKQITFLSPQASPATAGSSRLVHINVGGTVFTTLKTTLQSAEGTFFEGLVSERFSVDRDKDGNIFIDRDPKHFKHILNWLRDRTFGGLWPLEDESFHSECNFYGLAQRMYVSSAAPCRVTPTLPV